MRKINRLTPFQVSRIKAPGRYRDGAGLLLQVTPTGSKSWQLRYQRHGRERMMGLGGLDAVSLAASRTTLKDATFSEFPMSPTFLIFSASLFN